MFHEAELVLGLWDGFPVSDGHALLVTRRHVASWFDATREERHALTDATDIARQVVEARFGSCDYNIGVNVGVLPTKGLTLPLLSFGGSGIVANCVALAILMRIDFENRRLLRGFTL